MEALFKYLLAISNKQKSTISLLPKFRGKILSSCNHKIISWKTVLLTLLFTVPQLGIFSGITQKKTLAQSNVCPAGTSAQTLNWTPVNNRAGIESQTPSVGDINASFRFTEASPNVLDNDETRIISGVYGGLPGPNLQFNIGVGDSPAPPNGTATLTITFNQPVTLGAPLQLLDIDRNGERDIGFVYQDTVRVNASNQGNSVNATLTSLGPDVRIVNNQARGIRENSFPEESDGNALATITEPVDQIQIIYSAGTEYGTPEQDETIGLTRLTICATAPGSNGFIGDTVFNDLNGNGTQDEGEPVVPGVNLTLIAPGPDNQFGTDDDATRAAATGENGLYGFSDLPPGQYRVRVQPPENLPQVTTEGGSEVSVNLEPGQRRDDIDFGLQGSNIGSIGDTVFNDLNGNGTQDEGEPVVPGVNLTLIAPGPDNQFGTDDDTTRAAATGENGLYGFSDLPAGEYRVRVQPPENLPQVTTEGGSEVSVNLEPGQRRDDIDFGLQGSNTGSIGDTVFNDLNGNGTQDEGEPVVPGVNLTLIAPGPDNQFGTDDDTTRAAATGENGLYGFSDLPAGEYRVRVQPPENLPQVTTEGGSEVSVNLESGQRRDDIDFGLRNSENGSIGGTVFTDPNGNGVQDTNDAGVPNNGENGIDNITVTLRNSDGEVVATNTTDNNGNYQFADLPLGEYTVESSTPDNLSATTETILAANISNDNPNVNNIDFGFRPGTVGAGGDVNLRLVKRITNQFRDGQAIGGNFNSFVDDPNDDDDNIFNNSAQTSPLGVPQLETPVRSGDEIEYTIYYLTEGGEPLGNVRLCDLIPEGTTFVDATGIPFRQGATNTTLTSAQDGDRGTFYSPLTPLNGQPGADACSNQSNPNGAVVVNIGTITPNDNFGFFRFRVRIN